MLLNAEPHLQWVAPAAWMAPRSAPGLWRCAYYWLPRQGKGVLLIYSLPVPPKGQGVKVQR